MDNFGLKLKSLFIFVLVFLLTPLTYAETNKSKPAKAAELPVSIESNTKLYTDAKRRFKCVIFKDWSWHEVNEYAVVFFNPDEVFFINCSRNPLRAMYYNVPQRARKLSWKEFLDRMLDKKVFQQFSKDMSLQSSSAIAKSAKIISVEEIKIAGRPASLIRIEGLMPQKETKFEARDIVFIDGEDIFTVDVRAFFKGSKSVKLEKEFSSTVKQILNTFEIIKK
jgi:hypothetical protein